MTSRITDRLATVTSVLRVRKQDAERHVRNGGTNGDLRAREERAMVRLEQLVERLEKATA